MFEDIKPSDEETMQALKDSALASRAKELLDNEAYIEAKSRIKAGIFAAFESPALSSEEREKLWLYCQMFNRLDANIEAILGGAETAKVVLDKND